jgi:hypothetical protein
MATTLIDTRKPIMDQIHASWNEYRRTEEGMLFMFGEVGSNYNCWHNIPLAKDFKKDNAPWSTKQSVLERNAVHANKLIRLYISLNIDVERRIPICLFFETGVVSEIKEQIKLLKRIQKVLKLEQELDIHEPLPNATSLFTYTAPLSLDEIEADFKVKVKEAKAEARAEEKKRRQAWAKTNKVKKTPGHTRNNARNNEFNRKVLNLLTTASLIGMNIQDVIVRLERELD